jgi:hypothetical protein
VFPALSRHLRLYFPANSLPSGARSDSESEDRTAALLLAHVKERVMRDYEAIWRRNAVADTENATGEGLVWKPDEARAQIDKLTS